MANSIIDDTTAIAKRLREITGETTKAKVVKVDCIHCRDVGWVRSSPSSRWRECGMRVLEVPPEARLLERRRPCRFAWPIRYLPGMGKIKQKPTQPLFPGGSKSYGLRCSGCRTATGYYR